MKEYLVDHIFHLCAFWWCHVKAIFVINVGYIKTYAINEKSSCESDLWSIFNHKLKSQNGVFLLMVVVE
jgi:hypothetical protein